MYRSVRGLRDAAVDAVDGRVGFEEQVFFDDEKWVIRYLVVDTERPTGDHAVLISPMAMTGADAAQRIIRVNLTMQQVASSPDIDTERPVSRQKEIEYSRYYSYPLYWGGSGLWHQVTAPAMLIGAARRETDGERAEGHDDVHLRSSREVIGYRVRASDGRIGHIEDLVFDETSWAIAFVQIDTRNWIGGKKVLVPPRWIGRVSWAERRVYVDLPLAAIKEAPAIDSIGELTPEHEAKLLAHFRRVSGRG